MKKQLTFFGNKLTRKETTSVRGTDGFRYVCRFGKLKVDVWFYGPDPVMWTAVLQREGSEHRLAEVVGHDSPTDAAIALEKICRAQLALWSEVVK
jgi:hypothetical protein